MAPGSPQYTSVRKNYESLTQFLEVNEEAKKSLTRKYKSEGWLDPVATPSEDKLVSQVLVRIKDDSKQYDVFISMLKEIVGTEEIVKKLTGKLTLRYRYVVDTNILVNICGTIFT